MCSTQLCYALPFTYFSYALYINNYKIAFAFAATRSHNLEMQLFNANEIISFHCSIKIRKFAIQNIERHERVNERRRRAANGNNNA